MQASQLCDTLILGWKNRLGLSDASNLLAHHRSYCDGCRYSIDDGTGGRHDPDAGVSGHDDRQNGGCEARADLNGHHRQLHEPHGPGGFGYPSVLYDFPVKITSMNEATVVFHGSNQSSITGSIDRVTGDVEADTEGPTSIHYALKCRPTQRMF